jgi:hypothetical protein
MAASTMFCDNMTLCNVNCACVNLQLTTVQSTLYTLNRFCSPHTIVSLGTRRIISYSQPAAVAAMSWLMPPLHWS